MVGREETDGLIVTLYVFDWYFIQKRRFSWNIVEACPASQGVWRVVIVVVEEGNLGDWKIMIVGEEEMDGVNT